MLRLVRIKEKVVDENAIEAEDVMINQEEKDDQDVVMIILETEVTDVEIMKVVLKTDRDVLTEINQNLNRRTEDQDVIDVRTSFTYKD